MRTSIRTIAAAIIALSTVVQAQKQLPPEGGTPRDFKLPKKHQFTLPNGLAVTMVPYGSIPKVTVSVVIRFGNINEKEHQVWLADIVGDLMKEGTTSRPAQQVATEAAAWAETSESTSAPI